MDGWIMDSDGWMDASGWIGGWMDDGWMMDRWMYGLIDELMNEWLD